MDKKSFFLIYFISIVNIVKCLSIGSGNNTWVPGVGTTWNWLINAYTEEINSDDAAEVLGIDLFDHTASTIKMLKDKGHKVICYFSAGTLESRRPDTNEFLLKKDLVKNKMDSWEEYYLDINNSDIKPLMAARLDLAKEKGCDAVEPDNIDIYQAESVKAWPVPVTKEDQLVYDKWLSEEARKRGLSIALKNDIANAQAMVDYFDFAINENCYAFNECGLYVDSFINAGKAVFAAVYGSVCDKSFLDRLYQGTKDKKLSIIIKNEDRLLKPDYTVYHPETDTYDTLCKQALASGSTSIKMYSRSKVLSFLGPLSSMITFPFIFLFFQLFLIF